METPRFGGGPAWESDPHFRITTHPNRILIWTSDPRGYVDYVNPAWSALTGIHGVSLLGFGWHAAVDPLDLPTLRTTLTEAAEVRAAFRQPLRIRRHDGQTLSMVMEGQPRIDDLGTHIGYLVTCFDVAPHSEVELELDLAEERLADLVRTAPLPGIALDAEGLVIFLNDAFCRLTGRASAELINRKFAAALGIDDTSSLPARLFPDDRQRPDFPQSFETHIVRSDRAQRTVRWQAMVLRRFSGQAKGVILLGEDVTDEFEAEKQLLLTHRVFETADQAMLITDAEGTIQSVNRAFTRLTGYPPAEAIGRNPRLLQSGRHDQTFYRSMWTSIRNTGSWHGDIWDRRKDGSIYPKFLSISAIRDERGEVANYSGIFHDISERKGIEEQLDQLAHVDALTGLANRVQLFDRCEAAVLQASRSGHRVGLIFVDLDHFKATNDTLGREAGDALLKTVADRLRCCAGRDDTVARIGGDEFALVLPGIADVDDVARIGHKILDDLSLPVALAGRSWSITASIGAAVLPGTADDLDALLRRAEYAMYRAKQAGGARLALDPTADREIS